MANMEITEQWILVSALVTQVITILGSMFAAWRITHSKKKWIREQISCKKREIWDIQKQLTSIVVSGDKTLLTSDYVKELANRLRALKAEIAELNGMLKPKDQDNTKLNVTESIKVLQETISKLGGK